MVALLESVHWGAVAQIIIIDILLGGDNAVVIALACRNLPARRRMQGIIWGTAGAIALRIVLIAFALTLLELPWLKLTGGLLLVWIGVRLLLPEHESTLTVDEGGNLWRAIRTIILADLVMSLDNIIAIAAAANHTQLDHQLYYVVFGLLVSVPVIVWGSTLVLKLIDRFPVVVTLGAGLLGWIAGGMLIGDVAVLALLQQNLGDAWVQVSSAGMLRAATPVHYWASALGALLVIGAGRVLSARAGSKGKE
ncbi:MAG: TerC family protein [Castellaniella sp.]